MAKVESSLSPEDRGFIRDAGEAMLLMVNRGMWESLARQAKSEMRLPGDVLNDALRMYLESKGSDDTVEYLRVLGTRGAS
jgi:hypothetical protein